MSIDRDEIGRAAPSRQPNGIALRLAQRVVEGGVAWAESNGLVLAVAVVDIGGHPVAMARMDGASILAGEVVVQKARLAAWLGRPTASAVDIGREWPHVYMSFVSAAQGSIIVSKGGIPLVQDGYVVGAVGASGGSAEQDQACSEAGARAGGFGV
ncbi:MAG: heme-binding protein [Chloroflexi bacterium]|nr:heme-binding protein [Chloroflexota bacterium]